MAEQPDGAPEAQPRDDLRSPEAWAEVLFPVGERGRPARDSWKHAAASNLHGWTAHAYHEGEPLRLSRGDYEAALAAATTLTPVGPKGGPTYTPHPAALSRHAPVAARAADESGPTTVVAAADDAPDGASPPPLESTPDETRREALRELPAQPNEEG